MREGVYASREDFEHLHTLRGDIAAELEKRDAEREIDRLSTDRETLAKLSATNRRTLAKLSATKVSESAPACIHFSS